MSYVAERGWQIEARRRREIYLKRITDVTTAYAAKNRERLEALREQGLDVYVPEEYGNCWSALERVEHYLSEDPEEARDENIRLSAVMRSLGSLARENRRAAQAAERDAAQAARESERDLARERLAAERDARTDRTMQEQTARDELLEMVRAARRALPGAIERDLCQPELAAIRQEIERRPMILEELELTRLDLKGRLDSITAIVLTNAEAQRFADQRDDERREMSVALDDAMAMYSGLSDDLAKTAVRDLQYRMVNEQVTMQTLDAKLAEIRQASDDRAMKESARRIVIGGLLSELRNAGFIVSEPKLEGGESAAVVIKAQRPSGAQAAFRVNLDGMTYKFDHYQGQACLDDANKVLPRLQDMYGINLEEEKVSWRNPDLIGKSEKRLPDSSGGRAK